MPKVHSNKTFRNFANSDLSSSTKILFCRIKRTNKKCDGHELMFDVIRRKDSWGAIS